MEFSPSTQVEKLAGWETIPESDRAPLRPMVKKVPSNGRSGMNFLLFKLQVGPYLFLPPSFILLG